MPKLGQLPVYVTLGFLALCFYAVAGCYPSTSDSPAPKDRAEITLTFADFHHHIKNGRHFFTHQRIFHAKNTIRSTIKRGRLCVENGQNCLDMPLNYAIPANGKFIQTGHYFSTPLATDRITFTYWLEDQHKNQLKLEKQVIIAKGSVIAIIDPTP